MIDNFELIIPHFYFSEANNMFFHCHIVQRHKDNSTCTKDKVIHTYFIRSKEHLKRLRGEIILLCETYGARAYINIAGKDFYKVNNELLLKLAICSKLEDRDINPRKLLNSAAGLVVSRCPKWIIDIDNEEDKKPVYEWLRNLGWEDYQIIKIPTVKGCHFITSKFNLNDFRERFPNIDVHKNSMGTLLYYPESLTIKSNIHGQL